MPALLKWLGGFVLVACLGLVGIALVLSAVGGAKAGAESGGATGGIAGAAAGGLIGGGLWLAALSGGILFGAILFFIGRTLERQDRADRYGARRGRGRVGRPRRHPRRGSRQQAP